MMRPVIRNRTPICLVVLAALPLLLAGAAAAQENRSPSFIDNLFSRGEQPSPAQAQPRDGQSRDMAQADAGDLSVRLDRIENAMRQLTGTLEQLQYRNQQLEMQLKRMQDDTEYRFQQLGAKGAPGAARPGLPPAGPANAPQPAPANSGRRGDVFDPSQNPNAPGAPRTLGNPSVAAAPAGPAAIDATDGSPVGAPGGRAAGAPLDLSSIDGRSAGEQPPAGMPLPPPDNPPPSAQPRNVVNANGGPIVTQPPSASPQDEYDMAYGYVLHKDYALAEQAFRDFLQKHPNERLVPDAQYWLGETMFQRQRYRDAAESFLAVSTKFDKSGKAPDALLRLGQSLAALNQKEAACATLAEIARKYPKASSSVKRGVSQEQKRAHC